MRIAELFAGSRSIGKAAEALGHEVFSVDIKAFPGIHLVRDIERVELFNLPWIPDLIWASPPCTTYSLLAIKHHRPKGGPLSEFAAISDRLVKHTRQLIEESGALYVIENPRATLRKMPFMQGLDRRTVWYCRYGDTRAKPTDLWCNFFRSLECPEGWDPRPECSNDNPVCDHDRQPRTYQKRKDQGLTSKGTTGATNAYERSKLPPALCREVIEAAARVLRSRQQQQSHGHPNLEILGDREAR